jgi:RHS repeat-associated protein
MTLCLSIVLLLVSGIISPPLQRIFHIGLNRQVLPLASDANGNLTNDGTRGFTFDAENRLVSVFSGTNWRTDFVYDGLGRRRVTKDSVWYLIPGSGGVWVETNETRYICDGLLPIQERDINNNVCVSYTRGLDLSGALGAGLPAIAPGATAGGIGGLLARTDGSGSTFYHSDGEGNITTLIDGYQVIQGRYLYDPFGRVLGQWGAMAAANNKQFSSMAHHANSGLTLYPFRVYDPIFPRFLNQDPGGEASDINLYRAMANSPVNVLDRNGRDNIYNTSPSAGSWNNNVPAMTISGPVGGGTADASFPGGGLGDPLLAMAAAVVAGTVAGAAAENPELTLALAQVAQDLQNSSGQPAQPTTSDLQQLALQNALASMIPGGNTGGDAEKAVKELADLLKKLGKKCKGIYKFTGKTGKPYVGQSSDIAQRLKQHLGSGKLPPDEIPGVETTDVPGDKTAREIAEQQAIDDLGGLNNTENLRNPIGPNRVYLVK